MVHIPSCWGLMWASTCLRLYRRSAGVTEAPGDSANGAFAAHTAGRQQTVCDNTARPACRDQSASTWLLYCAVATQSPLDTKTRSGGEEAGSAPRASTVAALIDTGSVQGCMDGGGRHQEDFLGASRGSPTSDRSDAARGKGGAVP